MQSMRKWIACWMPTLLLAALGGCGTLSHIQFHVPDPSGDAANRQRVVSIVQNAAINAGMVDRTEQSRAARTLIYFKEPAGNFPMMLGARSTDEYLVIDLACFHFDSNEPPAFSVTKVFLENALKAEFGRDWRLVTDRPAWIPVARNHPAP
jgi:predicted aminopeptidase